MVIPLLSSNGGVVGLFRVVKPQKKGLGSKNAENTTRICLHRLLGILRGILSCPRNSRFIVILLVLYTIFILPASAAINQIAQGGDVFIGEEGLDVTDAMGDFANVAWFASGTNPNTDTPNYIVLWVIPQASMVLLLTLSAGPATGTAGMAPSRVLHSMWLTPASHIKIWDQNANKDVTGKQVPAGNFLNFRVETNTYSVVNRPGYAGEGFVKIKVKNV